MRDVEQEGVWAWERMGSAAAEAVNADRFFMMMGAQVVMLVRMPEKVSQERMDIRVGLYTAMLANDANACRCIGNFPSLS